VPVAASAKLKSEIRTRLIEFSIVCRIKSEAYSMTLRRLSTHLLLGPADIPPSRDDFEVIGVFNPGAVRVADEVVLLVRVAERPRERRTGFTGLPRWNPAAGLMIDWVSDVELEPIDTRVVRRKADGLVRLTFVSHLRVVRCGAGKAVREVTNVTFRPHGGLEEFGVEDPRITPLNGRFYFTYVAVSRHGAATALASTSDFRTFDRHGIIFCPENKDVVLFPDKIGGDFAALHRPVGGTPFTRPEMWVARSPDLIHWGAHDPLIVAGGEWQSGRVGAGPPPLRLPGGWLAIYHGNRHPSRTGEVGEYAAGAVLLDADDPTRVVKQTVEPFMRPEADFEVAGFVANVVFPTGLVPDGDKLLVYYGAADAATAVAEFEIRELLELMVHS
jgi:beta-1,2-mannobiose phosphorylase / 1,2-beta-oligomannan phosphorylase